MLIVKLYDVRWHFHHKDRIKLWEDFFFFQRCDLIESRRSSFLSTKRGGKIQVQATRLDCCLAFFFFLFFYERCYRVTVEMGCCTFLISTIVAIYRMLWGYYEFVQLVLICCMLDIFFSLWNFMDSSGELDWISIFLGGF